MISLQRWMKEERREKKKRERYSVTVVTVFRGRSSENLIREANN